MNSLDRIAVIDAAVGVCRQTGAVTKSNGCTPVRATAGVWNVTLDEALPVGQYVFAQGVLSGITPGAIIQCLDVTDSVKQLLVHKSDDGSLIDLDFTFQFRALP